MGYSIQIRYKDRLVIPEDSHYVPPNPNWPNYIKLGGEHMDILIQFMVATGVVDAQVRSSKEKKKCRAGAVPVYKFCWNDGFVVTAKEAHTIAESLSQHDLLSDTFLKQHFPKVRASDKATRDLFSKLITLWIPYNRVAAANNGYAIR